MAAVTIRNLPEETHRALKVRAARNGRSTEAELRDILDRVVNPSGRVKLGTELAALGRKIGLTADEAAVFDNLRDKTPVEPVSFD